VRRDDRVPSLSKIDKLYHEFKLILPEKHVHRAFDWPKYAFNELSDA